LATVVACRLALWVCEVFGVGAIDAAEALTVAWRAAPPSELTVIAAARFGAAEAVFTGGVATGVTRGSAGVATLVETSTDAGATDAVTVAGPTVAETPMMLPSANADGVSASAASAPTAVRHTSCLRSRGDPFPMRFSFGFVSFSGTRVSSFRN
jgi:hypothetical protein